MITAFQPNKADAIKHIDFISGQKNSTEVFQVYPDSEHCGVYPKIFIGTLEQHWDEFVRLNQKGAAIAVVVNQTDLKGRSENNILKVRAFFTDDDNNLNLEIPMDPPSFTVLSKNGPHKYYSCKNIDVSYFTPMQKYLADIALTDSQVCDVGRAMRLAGFFHMKDPSNPFMVKIESIFEDEIYAKINAGS